MKRLTSATKRWFHHLIDALLRVDSATALNAGRSDAPGGGDIAAELLAALQTMKAEAFEAERGAVDYRLLREGDSYRRYRACTAGLIDFQPQTLTTREQRLAFWINLYNALVIDAVIAFGVTESVRRDLGFFRRAAYLVGGLRYSADDIEHGILRGNRRHFHPAIWFPQFAPDDPRLAHSIRPVDARIHCALVCASRSCPPFAVYEAERIDSQLEAAARSFVNGGGAVADVDRGRIYLSPIFRWYGKDFGGTDGVRQFVLRYLEDDTAARIVREPRLQLRYLRYDWSLNTADRAGWRTVVERGTRR